MKVQILSSLVKMLKEDKKNIFYLLYYSALESILALSIPLASSFIINSVLAHASISIYILGFIIISVFTLVTFLQVIKEYVVEKFQQKIFIKSSIEIAKLAISLDKTVLSTRETINQYMNYFFDVVSLQKTFPLVLLDGSALIIKIIISLLLLLAFDFSLFVLALILFSFFVLFLLFLGKNGITYAIERSDAKHKSIYYLQSIPNLQTDKESILQELDGNLENFASSREKSFKVIIRQQALSFFMEGVIMSVFLVYGGYLVINGTLPVGEFVAAEIVVVSIVYAIKGFIKQIDYVYDMIEGLYKVNKLSKKLEELK